MTERGACKDCLHWWSWEAIGKNGYGKGECRRYPPAVALLPKSVGGDTDRATPVTGAHYWCGEFRRVGGEQVRETREG